jgi:hypothetical protein
MALTHTTAVRNAIADLVVDRVDAGVGAGKITFLTAADAEVAVCPFSDPAFGNAGATVAGRADASAITSDTTAIAGTIAKAVISDSNDLEVFRGTVGTTGSGADFEFNSVIISTNQTVGVTSMTYAAPA